jgi:hypothetical protein
VAAAVRAATEMTRALDSTLSEAIKLIEQPVANDPVLTMRESQNAHEVHLARNYKSDDLIINLLCIRTLAVLCKPVFQHVYTSTVHAAQHVFRAFREQETHNYCCFSVCTQPWYEQTHAARMSSETQQQLS